MSHGRVITEHRRYDSLSASTVVENRADAGLDRASPSSASSCSGVVHESKFPTNERRRLFEALMPSFAAAGIRPFYEYLVSKQFFGYES